MPEMEGLHTVLSPIFPAEKDFDVPADYTPLTHSGSVQVFIKLVEPVIFLQGFESSKHSNHQNENLQSSILRGSLIVRVTKPTKLKSINLKFKGQCRTEWPEGIPPKRNEFVEINDVVNHTWPFYTHDHQKYIPITSDGNNNNNEASHIDYLLKNSGAAIFKPLPQNEPSNINNTTPHGFSLSPVSSLVNIPTPAPQILLHNNSTIPTTHKESRQSRTRNASITSGSSPKSGPIRSLSPLNLFRKKPSYSDVTNKSPVPNRLHSNSNNTPTNIQSENTIDSNLTTNKKLNHPPTSNSIFSDLFGISIPVTSTAQTNNSDILTNTQHGVSNHRSRGGSITSTINNNRNLSAANIDTATLSSNIDPPSDVNSVDESSKTATTASTSISETRFVKSSAQHDSFIFETGDYIYMFEQAISQSYPESFKSEYGLVEYSLSSTIERFGAFKGDLTARLPVTIVRTPSDNSVEESEPIIISRDWEKHLYYDILIASKDIILDAFLPIHFTFSPLDKVTLHRVRVYVTETMESYCKNKKVHRMEPTKKFLLAEHCGPKLPNAPSGKTSLKAKYMGNLLEEDGYLVNKDFELQVFIPNRFGNNQQLHPDTGFDTIKSSHWIKICLRLSRMVDNKRKHYEISIDSPIHVLNKLCSHANILLPTYDANLLTNSNSFHSISRQGSTNDMATNEGIYHNSNIFFPKEIMMSPLVSPEVKPLDINSNSPPSSPLPRSVKSMVINNKGASSVLNNITSLRTVQGSTNNNPNIFKSPKLRSNIYRPESLQRELASPQAIPLSPVTSPRLYPTSMLSFDDCISLSNADSEDPPPSFDSVCKERGKNKIGLPFNPPRYCDIMQQSNRSSKLVPKIVLNKSQESLFSQAENEANIDSELESTFNHNDDDTDVSDIASGFSFQGSLAQSLSSSINPIATRNKLLDSPRFARRGSIQDNLPSTIRTDNGLFADISQILSDNSEDEYNAHTVKTVQSLRTPQSTSFHQSPNSSSKNIQDISNTLESNSDNNLRPSTSIHSSCCDASARSSFDTSAISLSGNTSTMEPLLHPKSSGHMANKSLNESFLQSIDSINEYTEDPIIDTSVDITALYDRNSVGWVPLQLTSDLHFDTPTSQSKLGNDNDTGASLSPTESTAPGDEMYFSHVSRTNENNEPKLVLDIDNDEGHLPKIINETFE